MKDVSYLAGYHLYLQNLFVTNFKLLEISLLVVDTGTAVTTINEFDARQMKVDYSKLTKYQNSLGIGGSAESYLADSCHLYFGEGIESVDVKPVKFLRQTNVAEVDQERYPSLLGMDVLRNYKISFNESKVILERNSRS